MSLKQIYVFFIAVLIQTGFAQVSFKYGVELGYGFAQKPEYPYQVLSNSRNDVITIKRSNESSPVVGLAGDLLIGKHLHFGFGVQYQKLASHYSERREGSDLWRGETFVTNETIDQSFSTLCFPISLGVTARIWKFSPTFFIGIRPNYVLNGYYSSNYTHDHSLDSLDFNSTYRFNPFDRKDTDLPANKLIGQAVRAGVSLFIGEYIKLSYYNYVGGKIYYSFGSMSCFGYSCDNMKHMLSITLFAPHKKKPNTGCKLVHKRNTEVPID